MGLISSTVYSILLIGLVPAALLFTSVVKYLWKKWKIALQVDKIPGPKGSFFLGMMGKVSIIGDFKINQKNHHHLNVLN